MLGAAWRRLAGIASDHPTLLEAVLEGLESQQQLEALPADSELRSLQKHRDSALATSREAVSAKGDPSHVFMRHKAAETHLLKVADKHDAALDRLGSHPAHKDVAAWRDRLMHLADLHRKNAYSSGPKLRTG